MTIKELRELIKDLPDDAIVLSTDDSYEMKGSLTEARFGSVGRYSTQKRWFRDDFDGTSYSATVYVPDEEGQLALRL